MSVLSVIMQGFPGEVDTIANLTWVSPPGIPPNPIWFIISLISPPNIFPKSSDIISFLAPVPPITTMSPLLTGFPRSPRLKLSGFPFIRIPCWAGATVTFFASTTFALDT